MEKLVRADNARDYRTFCRQIGPSERLLRQSDYGGRRVSMGKRGGRRRARKKEQKGGKKTKKEKKSAIPNNGVESTRREGSGEVAFFRGELIDSRSFVRSLNSTCTLSLALLPSSSSALLHLPFVQLSHFISLFLSRVPSLACSLARSRAQIKVSRDPPPRHLLNHWPESRFVDRK